MVDRSITEAVAAIVSLGNNCRSCVELHTGRMDAIAAARGADDPGYDHRVREIADWARSTRFRDTVGKAGTTPPPDQLPELIGVVAATHYVNRMVNVLGQNAPGVTPDDRAVPDRVREVVRRALSEWDGRVPGSDKSWVGELVSVLPFEERPVARLALLTAMASHQVDRSVIDAVDRTTLVEVCAWASLAAAERVTDWITATAPVLVGC